MSQSSLSIGNVSRSAFRAAVNAALQALASLFSGSSAPVTAYPYQLWYDTGATPNVLKIRNAANSDWVIWGRPADPSLCPFYADNAEVGRFDADGNLGIGIDTPAYKLDVDGDINITGDFLVNGVALGAEPPDDSITFAKIQNFTANSVLCRASGTTGDSGLVTLAASRLLGRGSTGDIAAISLGAGLAMSGTTMAVDHGTSANKIVRLDASAKLPAVDGSALLNVGGQVVVSTVTLEGGESSIQFTDLEDFDLYVVELFDITGSADFDLRLRTSSNGGSSYDSGGSDYTHAFSYLIGSSSSVGGDADSAGDYVRLTTLVDNTLVRGVSGELRFYGLASTVAWKKMLFDLIYVDSSGDLRNADGAGARKATAAVNAVSLYPSTGTFTGGKAVLYGVRTS